MVTLNGNESAAPQPVTVSITRRVDPGRVPEVTRWVQEGVNLANRWPGFLGSGWVRASAESEEWHMLYRFSEGKSLDDWERSGERGAWLRRGEGLVEERKVSKRTGIEGWFDEPINAGPINAGPTDAGPTDASEPRTPPRWKQAVSIWIGFFPVNLVFTWLAGEFLPGWNELWVLPRVLITTAILTPIMAYWVLPFVTRTLRPWLVRASRNAV
ncbi:antibiotic biosynthesis monooxygenase [soil metagenome]